MNDPEIYIKWKPLLMCLVAIAIVSLIILSIMIPVKMATKKGRSGFGWFIFCLFFSPFLAIIIIALLGETDEKRRERIIEEEKLRNKHREPAPNHSQNNLKKWFQENPGKTLNEYYNKL
jgi:hypothetical protein